MFVAPFSCPLYACFAYFGISTRFFRKVMISCVNPKIWTWVNSMLMDRCCFVITPYWFLSREKIMKRSRGAIMSALSSCSLLPFILEALSKSRLIMQDLDTAILALRIFITDILSLAGVWTGDPIGKSSIWHLIRLGYFILLCKMPDHVARFRLALRLSP